MEKRVLNWEVEKIILTGDFDLAIGKFFLTVFRKILEKGTYISP